MLIQRWTKQALQTIADIARRVRQIEYQVRRYKWGYPIRDDSLVGIELAEDHPGRGLLFDVYLGVWNSATHSWDYERTVENIYSAIDWWYSVSGPYPDKCATGLAQWRKSDSLGRILQVVGLDCNSPGCGS